MTKKILAMALSASLALTSITATPVRAADNGDKFLAGLAALLIIGAVANQANQDRNPVQSKPKSTTKTWGGTPPRQARKKAAPQRCLRDQWTHRGTRQVYGARCMDRHADARLPRNCLRQADVNQGPRRFYTKRCLRKNGWRA